MNMTRRKHLQLMATAAGTAAFGGTITQAKESTTMKPKKVTLPKYTNADFYKDGKFQPDAAKKAYLAMMASHGYDIHIENEKKWTSPFWVSDFGLGDFVNVGMGGVFWVNFQDTNFFAHEIFLLPGQMIVEHGHVKTEKSKPKMEAWHVRHGMIYTFGEGPATEPCPVNLPESQIKYITCKNAKKVMPGEIDSLKRAEAKHFMYAGPEGAIVTEYATYHDGDGLRFTNPVVKL